MTTKPEGTEIARSPLSGFDEYTRATLNILDDFGAEKARLEQTQRAVVNILDDAASERLHQDQAQRAVLNILDDATAERAHLEATQRAVLNILSDSEEEKVRFGAAQRAITNILEDFSAEKRQLEETQRATLNLLADFDAERIKAESASAELREAVQSLRLAKESVEEANKELDAFSYSVAHDLRTPLRAIDGFSKMLLEDCADRLDEDSNRHLRRVREAAQHMAGLIDGLLALSRVTRRDVQVESVDLSALARNTLERLQQIAPERKVDIAVQDSIRAAGDARLLGVALDNLLGNAWKFTAKQPHGRIEFGAQTTARPVVHFVRDNGAGFDMQYASKLFGVFQRLHPRREFEGTGIGLATVHRIVRRHGGRIWAKGEVGRGATVFFTLADEGTEMK